MNTDVLKSPIRFEGMKGVGDVVLNFEENQRVYTLIGTNGIGKTKCLESLFQVLFFTSNTIPEIFRDTPLFVANNRLNFEKLAHSGDNPVFYKDYFYKNKNSHTGPFVFIGTKNRGSIKKEALKQSTVTGSFADRKEKYFEYISQSMNGAFSGMNMDVDVSDWFVSKAQSSNPYQKPEDNRKIEIDTILRLLNKIDKNISSDFLQIYGNNHVTLKINDQYRTLNQLSSGFTSILKIIQSIVSGYGYFTNEDKLQNVPGIVLIDEIESHLHIQWQVKIIPLLKTLFPNTTFYITTHSPLVLTQLEQGEAYRLVRDDNGFVKTELIQRPNKAVLVDLLKEGFDVDLNALKYAQMSAIKQKDAKKRLLDILLQQGEPS